MYNYSDYYGGTGGTTSRTLTPMLPGQRRYGIGQPGIGGLPTAFGGPGGANQPIPQYGQEGLLPSNFQQTGSVQNPYGMTGGVFGQNTFNGGGNPYNGAFSTPPQYGAPNQQPQYNPYTGQPYGQQPWWYKAGMGRTAPNGGGTGGGGWFGNAYFNPAMTAAPTPPTPIGVPYQGGPYRGIPYGYGVSPGTPIVGNFGPDGTWRNF